MITHILLARWKPNTADADAQKLLRSIEELRVPIQQILSCRTGENFSKYSGAFTHAIVLTFANRDELQHYLRHPAHVAVLERWNKLQEEWIGVDFESEQ